MKNMRDSILEAGCKLINQHGFAGVGLTKIITEAGGTKGSFYHYFKSKEHFGEVLLLDYFEKHLLSLTTFLNDTTLPRIDRLQNYFQHWSDTKLNVDFSINCLAVKLSGEISSSTTDMRRIMAEGSENMIQAMAKLFVDGNANKEFNIKNPELLARILYSLWLGATLMAAMQHDRLMLSNAMQATLSYINP